MSALPEYELHAYVDGQLDAARVQEIEAWLMDHPEVRRQVHGWQNQNARLRAQFAGVVSEPVPDRLHPRAPMRLRYAQAAVMALLLGVGVALGWGLHVKQVSGLAALAGYAAEAHRVYAVESRHPVEVAGSDSAHLAAWLSKRLGRTLRIPLLNDKGFRLVGGRVLPHQGRAAAQLMYQDQAGQRLTLLVTTQDLPVHQEQLKQVVRYGVSSYYWADDGMACAVSAALSETPLRELAQLAYDRMEEPG